MDVLLTFVLYVFNVFYLLILSTTIFVRILRVSLLVIIVRLTECLSACFAGTLSNMSIHRTFCCTRAWMLMPRGLCGLEAKLFGLGLVVSGLGLVASGLGLIEVGLVASKFAAYMD